MKQLYKNSALSKEQIELGLAIFGEDELDKMIKAGMDLTKELEKNTRFKAIRTKAENDILQILNEMPPDMVTAEFLDDLQSWLDSQREAMAAQSKAKIDSQIKDKGHEGFFFRPLGTQTNTVKKMTDPASIWFSGGNA